MTWGVVLGAASDWRGPEDDDTRWRMCHAASLQAGGVRVVQRYAGCPHTEADILAEIDEERRRAWT